ncbi:hypothetical protein BEL04_02625 [Mucilaginibacter sp. PPCGB 2223]|uniref:ester cyclase n=1 Tax=Mucilaginibacter sp. PPCGB 2223 TaxID=1886027 RepID=UPI00082478EA|nr:ester cyclase [Mucilaginibacter sp. PPCGB 2223]OCX53221.1 hypothetical protein BEL04_02625 [Mucilaginibacter sp. PPCGB 2223]
MRKIIPVVIAAGFLAACNGHATLTVGGDSTAVKAEKNRITALTAVQNLSDKKIDPMFTSCAADFIDYGNGEDKPMKNQDSVKTMLKAFIAAFPDYKESNLMAFAHGDSVIVTGTVTGTFKNEMMGMKPTGKSFKYDDADIFTFNKDGKMTSHRSIQSTATFFSQLGVAPPPPPAPPKDKK